MPEPTKKQKQMQENWDKAKKELEDSRTSFGVDYNEGAPDVLRIYGREFESTLNLTNAGTWDIE